MQPWKYSANWIYFSLWLNYGLFLSFQRMQFGLFRGYKLERIHLAPMLHAKDILRISQKNWAKYPELLKKRSSVQSIRVSKIRGTLVLHAGAKSSSKTSPIYLFNGAEKVSQSNVNLSFCWPPLALKEPSYRWKRVITHLLSKHAIQFMDPANSSFLSLPFSNFKKWNQRLLKQNN